MKKCLLLFTVIFIFYIFVSKSLAKTLTIPNDALRIRIVPNSNSEIDQSVKASVKDRLDITMYDLLKDVKDSEEARKIVNDNLDLVKKDVEDVLRERQYNLGYKVNFGYNYFPEKEYRGIKYDEGYYESLLVTLGKGEGDNYWCVLFPPLCLIEADENDDVEYRSILEDILKKYIH
ncbi:MAG: stage II sporulation protein R [Bacilli bacterium]|nr:stage II sporulation protein R [Bacilli bacterium]